VRQDLQAQVREWAVKALKIEGFYLFQASRIEDGQDEPGRKCRRMKDLLVGFNEDALHFVASSSVQVPRIRWRIGQGDLESDLSSFGNLRSRLPKIDRVLINPVLFQELRPTERIPESRSERAESASVRFGNASLVNTGKHRHPIGIWGRRRPEKDQRDRPNDIHRRIERTRFRIRNRLKIPFCFASKINPMRGGCQ